MRSLVRLLLVVSFLAAPVAAKKPAQPVVPAPPVFPDPGRTSMSKENQRALGMEVAEQVFQQMPVLPDDSPETLYVRRLGQKLVATIPAKYSWPFAFHVIPEKDINAFALPGGQMFVNLGVITAAKSEAELAGVMGHEMAHVYMQHSAKQASKAQTTGMIAGIASAILGGSSLGQKAGGLVGQLGQMGIQVGAQGLIMKYSRNDESQADAVGAMILYQAGYDPQGMVDFFKTMGAQAGQAPSRLFSSHPDPGNRQAAIARQIGTWPVATYAESSPDFAQVHEHALQVKSYTAQEIQAAAKSGRWAAENQQNGAGLNSAPSESSFPTRSSLAAPAPSVTFQSIRPSPSMQEVNLGPLTIHHPANWPVVLPEQKGQFVTIAAAAAATSGGIAYGVLLNGTGAPSHRMSLDDLNARLIQVIGQRNELKQVSDPQAILVGGVEGRSTLLSSPSPLPDANGQAQAERDWLVTVPRRDGSLIFMIFVAPESDFAQLQGTYEAMVKSVRFP